MSNEFGCIKIEEFLKRIKGKVIGQILTDAKVRTFEAEYKIENVDKNKIKISRMSGSGDQVVLPKIIPIDREMIAFFGLYSGDGAKGSEDSDNPGRVSVSISFSQREPNLIRFAVNQFNRLFPDHLRFTFSLGEDSAYFMAGDGLEQMKNHYGGKIPSQKSLSEVRPNLDEADKRYLSEHRDVSGTNEEHLSFYYQHKAVMQKILTDQKAREIEKIGIKPSKSIKVTASLRRPFKKGARAPGGSSRADELHLGGLNGLGELFLKILYEMENSIYSDSKNSPQGLIEWNDIPSKTGERIKIQEFFSKDSYGEISSERPTFKTESGKLVGLWPRSSEQTLADSLIINPLFAYAAGLYMAEGATPKSTMFSMFARRPTGLSVEFTSSEDGSISIILRALNSLFPKDSVMHAWKIKVGSQYFAELVSIGLKHGVPMLRGGESGDGKLRTMEISLALKSWGLQVCPSLEPFADLYSHVEPTGAGVARVHFWASSSLGKWIFPLFVYVLFGNEVSKPNGGFVID